MSGMLTQTNPKLTRDIFNRAKRCLIDNGIPHEEAETVLQALCYIIVDEETEHLMFNAQTEVNYLKDAGIAYAQIGDELEYRENAQISGPEPSKLSCGWDDDLCLYSTAELEEIEAAWNNE